MSNYTETLNKYTNNTKYARSNQSFNAKDYYNKDSWKQKDLITDKAVYASGEIAEMLVKEYFDVKGFETFDLSKVKQAQIIDIDLAIRKGEIVKKIEVKYDSYTARTKSICLELRNLTRNVNSWYFTSGADELVVVPKGDESVGYMFSFRELRQAYSLLDIKTQKDNASGCWFEIGILNIQEYENQGFRVTRLDLPKVSNIEINGYSQGYREMIMLYQMAQDDNYIINEMKLEIPDDMKRREV